MNIRRLLSVPLPSASRTAIVVIVTIVASVFALYRNSEDSLAQGAAGVPDPPGLAAQYPGDVGIENDPAVVLVEQFEDASTSSVFSRWTDIREGGWMSLSNDVPPGSAGSQSLTIPAVGGLNTGGHLYKRLTQGINDTLYVRYYIKYPSNGQYSHNGIWIGGYNPPSSWPNPQAGTRPQGNDRFSASAEQWNTTQQFDHYDYWMDMRPGIDGIYWGNLLHNEAQTLGRSDQWMCVEQMVRLNNPVSESNGEHAAWIDGVKISHFGPGYPVGTWDGGTFSPGSGSPFEGFRWRSDTNLTLNYLWLQNYSPNDPAGVVAEMKFDHVVAATRYIGCLGQGTTLLPPEAPTNLRVRPTP